MGVCALTVIRDFAKVAGIGQGNSPRLYMLTVQVRGLSVDLGAAAGDTGTAWASIIVVSPIVRARGGVWHSWKQVPCIPVDKSFGPETKWAASRRKGQSFSQLDWIWFWLLLQQRTEVKTRNLGWSPAVRLPKHHGVDYGGFSPVHKCPENIIHLTQGKGATEYFWIPFTVKEEPVNAWFISLFNFRSYIRGLGEEVAELTTAGPD